MDVEITNSDLILPMQRRPPSSSSNVVIDALDGILFIYRILTVLDKSFIGDWKIISLEDWILRPKLRKLVSSRVIDAVSRLRNAASISPTDTEWVNRHDTKLAINAVQGFLFPLKTWDHMMEDDQLPRRTESGKILYEIDHNVLLVYEVPSFAHNAASRAIIPQVLFWSSNGMTMTPSLEMLGGGGISPFKTLVLIS